ncbi:MAG TPA: tRNA epoxyqueuosine(34) reductase QueG [Thermomicrobiaceae bacterium]|nr:tRNA epoxyqueuosine(34) reductase QueG [Thermomicrobiaceae bacterium]
MIERARLSELAGQAGIAVTAVTSAEPFEGLGDLLEARISAGHLAGLDWFTSERARFSADPRNLHRTARAIVAVGLPYWQGPLTPPDDGVPRGRIARYAWGRDYHRTLKERMRAFLALLEREAGRAIEARLLVDTARIVDRAAAARAGLGWYGKNTMILVPGHGSWVMLGELLLDLELEPDPPLRPKCGRCTRCLDICPTGALLGDYTLDTPRCLSYLTIELRGAIPPDLRPKLGTWVFGCDLCQETCPYTGAASERADPTFAPAAIENAFPSLHWLLRLSEDEFRQVYRGTAVLRTKRAGLARNAAVALGNIGTEADLEVLEEALAGHDQPLVRGHAAWAMARIDRELAARPLLSRLAREQDAGVRAEIEGALAGIA